MFGKDAPGGGTQEFEIDLSAGWLEYRQAIELLEHNDSSRALVLLAKAETIFQTLDDPAGLWRALIGQALLHWRDGITPLAIARALAALRAAETADDGFAVGCVAWQIANMMLGQGEHRRAADFLDQAQLALDAVGIAPPGGALAAAARLCNEIARWQQMYERQQLAAPEAETAFDEIQRDLMARLRQAAIAMREAPINLAETDQGMAFLVPQPPLLSDSRDGMPGRTGLGSWLSRLWRRLIQTADDPTIEGLIRISTAPPQALPPTQQSVGVAGAVPRPRMADVVVPKLDVALEVVPDPAPAERAMPPEQPQAQPAARVGLAIYGFGSFRVYCDDRPIDRWESARGRTIFKYLATRRATPVPKDQLADMFWPESEPELARRSLHQAIYCLRQTFKRLAPESQIVRFSDDRYQINPDLPIWIDAEEFGQTVELARGLRAAGKNEQAVQAYAVAVDLYGAPFLADDRYEEWTEEPRRTFQAMYLEALHWLARYHHDRGEHPAAILLCQRALAEESCDEEAHQLLMACYLAQGLRHLAVRQYLLCVNALKTELGLVPSDELETFYRRAVATG
jgi:DNA-binding SARP family transcriptional activator